MSLVKKPKMTEKRLAALRENRKHSRGPITAAGKQRIRAANLRHGFYSQADEAALSALGEDPGDFRELLERLRDQSTAPATLQEQLGGRLARAFMRMNRADRMLEGYALRQAKEEDHAREGRLHVQMMRLKLVSRNWELLAQSVARPRYLTTSADLEMMQHLHKEGVAKEMSEFAVALFYQLRRPGLPGPGDPGFADQEEYEKARTVVKQIKGIFGLDDTDEGLDGPTGPQHGLHFAEDREAPDISTQPDRPGAVAAQPAKTAANPYPQITEEQWEAREPVRQLLENILTRQVQSFDAQHHDLMQQCVAGPSPYERAAEIAPTHPNAILIQRMEDANCRQVLRMTSLIIRLKRLESQMNDREDFDASRDVVEKKGR